MPKAKKPSDKSGGDYLPLEDDEFDRTSSKRVRKAKRQVKRRRS